MGTFDTGIWNNDDSADWLADLTNSPDLRVIRSLLHTTDLKDYYLEAPEGARILCAADTLVAALGLGQSTVPIEVSNWIQSHDDLDFRPLVPLVLDKTRRVLGEHSELMELWRENGEMFPVWRQRVETLIRYLGG